MIDLKLNVKIKVILLILMFLLLYSSLGQSVDELIIHKNSISYSRFHSFTGLVVSATDNLDESVVESFDNELDLEIKEPLNEGETGNANERMDFKIDGGLRLYFDLLNYSEFVETSGEVLIEEGMVEESEIVDLNENGDNSEENGEAVEEGTNNETELVEEVIFELDDANEANSLENEEETIRIGITGNIAKFFKSITGKVIDEDVELNFKKVNVSKVRENIGKLDDAIIETIGEEAVLNLDKQEFGVEVNEIAAKESNVDYKWGYNVELKDLNFMAKIDVTSGKNIVRYDESSLLIDGNLLSFKDLVDSGYNVRFETPLLAIEGNNLSDLEVNLEENSTLDIEISNFTSPNVAESNESEVVEKVEVVEENDTGRILGR